MRSLIISGVLFALIVICIILNVGYINRTADRIEEMAIDLAAPTDKKLSALEEFWEKNDGLLGLSISTTNLDSIQKNIVSLRAAYETGNIAEFENQRALLFNSSDCIRSLERISVENIF